jgi:serine/threonine-protein kinase
VEGLEQLRSALAESYRIEGELGSGGMATVYRARDLRHGRDVAVKLLSPSIAAALSPERFLQEIQIAAQLQHPLIVPVFDSGRASGLYYYVMPLIAGETLRRRMEREKRLPVEEAVRLGREIAEALDYAHQKGVVHRDIKPENIMLSGGHPLVADFGIARAVGATDTGVRLTSTGFMVGTPHYMSPEQALSDPNLDGRSDIYSLACVIYEMVAGSPPYTGASLHAIISGHVAGKPPSFKTREFVIPPALERVLLTALAKDPAERFQSSGEFAAALEDPARVGRRKPTWGRSGFQRSAIAVAGGVMLAVAGWAAWSGLGPGASTDPYLEAVAPFDTVGPGLGLWREGPVDMLSQSLNGAGPLRVVPPTVVLRSWSGRADVSSARALSKETGAGIVVVGRVVGTGSTSVRLEVSVVDGASGTTIGDLDFRGSRERIDVAADSLTVAVLGAIGRTRSIGAPHLTTVGSRSMPALKAYLQGEQHFRRADWDAAGIEFERAAALDSTFAMAYYRIFQTRFYKGTGLDSLMWSYALRAGQLNRGLAPRESLMVAADSIMASVYDASLDASAQQRRQRVIATLDLANRRFPDDAEVWYQLGRTRSRLGPYVGIQPGPAMEALDRAIALDSSFAPAYVEAMMTSPVARDGDLASTRRYLEAYLRLGLPGPMSDAARLGLALMDPRRARSASVNLTLDTASSRLLYAVNQFFALTSDSAETVIRVNQQIARRPQDPSFSPDPFRPRRILAFSLAFRGHFADAFSVIGTDRLYLVSQIAALGGAPADSVTRMFGRLLAATPAPHRHLVFALPWWLRQGDTASITRAIALSARSRSPQARFLEAAGRAYLTLAHGDTAQALQRFLELPQLVSFDGTGDWERYLAVRLLNDRQRFAEALVRLDREVPGTSFPSDVVLLFERGRAQEGLGQKAIAARAFRRVAELWARGDSALQPMVTSAREAAERLGGGKSGS